MTLKVVKVCSEAKMRLAIAGAMKALQEKNKLLTAECNNVRGQLESLHKLFTEREQKYTKEKDRWHKELLEALAHGSEREQQLKEMHDTLLNKNTEIREGKAKLEGELSKQISENSLLKSKISSANERIEKLIQEGTNARSLYENRIAKLMEQNVRLDKMLQEYKKEKMSLHSEFSRKLAKEKEQHETLESKLLQKRQDEFEALKENFVTYQFSMERKVEYLETQLQTALKAYDRKNLQYEDLARQLRAAQKEKVKIEHEKEVTEALAKDMNSVNEKLVKSLKRSRTELKKYSMDPLLTAGTFDVPSSRERNSYNPMRTYNTLMNV